MTDSLSAFKIVLGRRCGARCQAEPLTALGTAYQQRGGSGTELDCEEGVTDHKPPG